MNKNRTRLRVVCFYGGKKYYTTQDIIPKELNTLLHSLKKNKPPFTCDIFFEIGLSNKHTLPSPKNKL